MGFGIHGIGPGGKAGILATTAAPAAGVAATPGGMDQAAASRCLSQRFTSSATRVDSAPDSR